MNTPRKLTRRQFKRKGNKCTECANAKFDEQWGEYKCIARCIRISNPVSYTGCEMFSKKTDKK